MEQRDIFVEKLSAAYVSAKTLAPTRHYVETALLLSYKMWLLETKNCWPSVAMRYDRCVVAQRSVETREKKDLALRNKSIFRLAIKCAKEHTREKQSSTRELTIYAEYRSSFSDFLPPPLYTQRFFALFARNFFPSSPHVQLSETLGAYRLLSVSQSSFSHPIFCSTLLPCYP